MIHPLISGTTLLVACLGIYSFIILNGGKFNSGKDKLFLFGIFCYLTCIDLLIFYQTKIYFIVAIIVGISAFIVAIKQDKKKKFDPLFGLIMFLIFGIFAPISVPVFGSVIYYDLDETRQ